MTTTIRTRIAGPLQVGEFVRVQSGIYAGMTGLITSITATDRGGWYRISMTSTGQTRQFREHELRRETRGQR